MTNRYPVETLNMPASSPFSPDISSSTEIGREEFSFFLSSVSPSNNVCNNNASDCSVNYFPPCFSSSSCSNNSSTYVPLIDFQKLCNAVFRDENRKREANEDDNERSKIEKEQDEELLIFEKACKEVGFFQLYNHDVSIERQEEILKLAKIFFSLPLKEKRKVKMGEGDIRGYFEVRTEHLDQFNLLKDTHYAGDLKEGYDFGIEMPEEELQKEKGETEWSDFWHKKNKWIVDAKDQEKKVKKERIEKENEENIDKKEKEIEKRMEELNNFKEKIVAYMSDMTCVANRLSICIAHILKIDKNEFSNFFVAPCAFFRLLHYPLKENNLFVEENGEKKEEIAVEEEIIEDEEEEDNNNHINKIVKKSKKFKEILCAPHTDYGCFTLLLQDEIGGLELFDNMHNKYVKCSPIKGALVVNIGDMLSYWSNGLMKSTIHRVVRENVYVYEEEKEENNIKKKKKLDKINLDRYSIPFFWSPSYRCKIVPLVKNNKELQNIENRRKDLSFIYCFKWLIKNCYKFFVVNLLFLKYFYKKVRNQEDKKCKLELMQNRSSRIFENSIKAKNTTSYEWTANDWLINRYSKAFKDNNYGNI